jgi:1-acyl-sn-glycerol-3-phosphate acyltransferase
MKKILSIVLTPIFYIVFGLILVMFHIAQIIALNLFGHNAHDKVVAALNWCLMKAHLILGAKYHFHNEKNYPTNQPLIVIANHQSMWDIPPLIWKFRKHHPKFIAKKELAKGIPSISYNLKHGGSVTIDRANKEESIKKIKKFSKFINKHNYAVCIFPEGSRSKDGKIKPFKIGGLKTLIEEMPNALVVPVAIKGTGEIDNKGSKFLKVGVDVNYYFLPERHIKIEDIEKDLNQIREEMISFVN